MRGPEITRLTRLVVLLLVSALPLIASDTCSLAQGENRAFVLYHRSLVEGNRIATRQAALNDINRALQLEPQNSLFWRQKASVLVNMEENEEALPCVEKALKLDPKSASTWELKAFILTGMNRNVEALPAINQAIHLGGTAENRLTQGQILMSLGRFIEAEKELDDAVNGDPKNPMLRTRRASAASRNKHWDKVIADRTFVIKSAGEVFFGKWDQLQSRAEAYLNLKQYDKAIADYKLSLKDRPDARQTHQGLLNVYRQTGDKKAAAAEQKFLDNLDLDLKPGK